MFEKANAGCANRLFEWCSAVIMTQIGILVLAGDLYLNTKPQLAFLALLQLGVAPIGIGLIFLGVGVTRLFALKRNGQWRNGPLIRAVGAAVGMLIWGQLFYGIVAVWLHTGEIFVSLAIWDTLVVFEYLSFKRALLDMKTPAVQVGEHVR